MNDAVGTPTGSLSGSGTVRSKALTASYATAPTAPPVNRGMPSTGSTRRRVTNERIASSGSVTGDTVVGRSGAYWLTVTGLVWIVAAPSRISRRRRGPTPRNE